MCVPLLSSNALAGHLFISDQSRFSYLSIAIIYVVVIDMRLRQQYALLGLMACLLIFFTGQALAGSRIADVGQAANSLTWSLYVRISCSIWSGQTLCQDNVNTETVRSARSHKHRWVYLIRHGEKMENHPKRPGLSERGLRRARCLRSVFGPDGRAIDFVLAQDFKPNGKRRRPYETVKPLARALDIPLDHTCDRDDTQCIVGKIKRHADRNGENVLVVWEHARLTNIAKKLGISGLRYPDDRYDVVFKIRNGKVHAIYSEECNGLDEQWINWRGKKKGKHGKGGVDGRLVDDESWADDRTE